ncbi:MAG: hypothetical protein CMD67_03820 [Gammaproteobacteria bacterium]|nr:hypothetical protein [Gammaproteobacteria bacterium]
MTKMDKKTYSKRPVAWLDGSLPNGSIKSNSPIYAIDCPPFLDPSVSKAKSTKRIDIKAGEKLVFLVENLLLPHEADKVIEITELLGYRDDAPGIVTAPGLRLNKSVHWLADENTIRVLFERLKPHLPQSLNGHKIASSLSQRINMYRYDKGDVFNPHIDGDWPGFGLSLDGQRMEQWEGMRSKLSLLLYLNGVDDGIEGGETAIYDEGVVRALITPKKGRALLFRHGHNSDTVLHAGLIVSGSIPKYIARINVLYEESNHYSVRNYFHD